MAKRYKVKRGEDLVSIAAKFGTTPQTLMNLNKVRTVSRGVGLKIPGAGQGRLNAPMYTPSQQRALGIGAPSGNVRGKDFFSTITTGQKPSFFESLRNALLGGAGFDTGGASGGSAIRGYAPKVQAAPARFGIGNGINAQSGAELGIVQKLTGNLIPNLIGQNAPQNTAGSFANFSRNVGQPVISGAGYGRQGALMLTPAQQLLKSQPTYAGTVHPNQVFDPVSRQWISTQPAQQTQLMAPTGYDYNQGGGLVEKGIVGDKWEFKNGVTSRAGRRQGKGGRARRQAWNAQAQENQVVMGDAGQVTTGAWRIGF